MLPPYDSPATRPLGDCRTAGLEQCTRCSLPLPRSRRVGQDSTLAAWAIEQSLRRCGGPSQQLFNSRSGETRPVAATQAERCARGRAGGADGECSAIHFGEECKATVPDLPECIGGSYTDWWTLHAAVLTSSVTVKDNNGTISRTTNTHVAVPDIPSLHMGARQVREREQFINSRQGRARGEDNATRTIYDTQLRQDRLLKVKTIHPRHVNQVPERDVFGLVHDSADPAANHRGKALFGKCGIVSSGCGRPLCS